MLVFNLFLEWFNILLHFNLRMKKKKKEIPDNEQFLGTFP